LKSLEGLGPLVLTDRFHKGGSGESRRIARNNNARVVGSCNGPVDNPAQSKMFASFYPCRKSLLARYC
jgi:hypothetical protein